jgi:hypothetical protein
VTDSICVPTNQPEAPEARPGRDPELVEHLAAAITAAPDPLPLTAVERVIALLAKVAVQLRIQQVHAVNPKPSKPVPSAEPASVSADDGLDVPDFLRRS